MKTVLLRLVFILALLFSFSVASEAQKEKKSVTFSVNMDCETCQKKIERNIAFEKGVQDLKTNLKEKTVTVTYDASKTDIKKLTQAFKKIGFEAQEKEAKS